MKRTGGLNDFTEVKPMKIAVAYDRENGAFFSISVTPNFSKFMTLIPREPSAPRTSSKSTSFKLCYLSNDCLFYFVCICFIIITISFFV